MQLNKSGGFPKATVQKQKLNADKATSLAKRFKESKYLLLLVLPCLVYYIIFHYIPMFGIVISFQKYNLFKGVWQSEWVGWKHYIMFFQNPDFFKLLRNTFLLSFYSIVFGFPAPIVLALLLNELKHVMFKKFVQSVSYLPHFISTVIVASMIVVFLSPSGGMINRFIEAVGLNPVNWLMQPEWFRTIYVSSGIWQGIGWSSIIYLAALTAVDPHLYEAAEMDGASRLGKMLHISIPGMMPVIVVLLILEIGSVLGVGFEKVFLLYNPATYETADILSTYVYRVGLGQGNYSYATAIGLFTGVVNLVLLVGANYFSRKVGETSLW
ncbi:ABC transporter permease [Paenibacillus eucommiae]|uniref:Aldouronate transport system permease protein n=1 Tax=Paenibacillus eucommiae TaxID=1355755 RepID=A0ABS4ILU5_9BACL|nr:ABC transporter permease subunit [Paenibacillus eucommiae]MBP1988551.1 putative aldouronate transport system permease protein [Paenibacillus eucommiae]